MDRLFIALKLYPVASVVALAIVIVSVIAFSRPGLVYELSLRPYDMVRQRKWVQFLTSGFVHADIQHLALNMLTFYFIAFDLENMMVRAQIQAHEQGDPAINEVLGHLKWALLYFISLVVCDLTTVLRHKDDRGYSSVGASGAISALVISFIIFAPQVRFWGFIPGWAMGLGYLASSYVMARSNRNDRIAHEAHFWGAASGVVFTWIMFPDAAKAFAVEIMSLFGA